MNNINIPYQTLKKDELSDDDQLLVETAIQALAGAHAPYSKFTVGSAVRMADQSIVSGNNQENAAYPSGLCAERVALFAAKAQSKQSIDAISIVAKNESKQWADAFSCGSCRQVMMEYAGQQDQPIRVLMGNSNGEFVVLEDARWLLPFSFDAATLA